MNNATLIRQYLLDTNAVVSLLAGNNPLSQLLEFADYVGISIISSLAFLLFDALSETDRQFFAGLCKRIEIALDVRC